MERLASKVSYHPEEALPNELVSLPIYLELAMLETLF
jgi:hypothetical protein